MKNRNLHFAVLATVFMLAASCTQADVRLQKQGEKYLLLRREPSGWEQPYFIKGASGDGSKEMLKRYGGNSFRTWGVEGLQRQLDEAQKLGLTVAAGIWLGHKEHGFNYHDAAQVAAQKENARGH